MLSADNKRQLWVPPGFLYNTTDYYAPEHERCIAWNDPTLVITWPELPEPPQTVSQRCGGYGVCAIARLIAVGPYR